MRNKALSQVSIPWNAMILIIAKRLALKTFIVAILVYRQKCDQSGVKTVIALFFSALSTWQGHWRLHDRV